MNNIEQPTVIGYKEHRQNVKRLHVIYTLLALVCLVWLSFAYFYNQTYKDIMMQETKLISKSLSVKVAKASTETLQIEATPEANFDEWMYQQWEQAGFKRKDVSCLNKHESGGVEDSSYINAKPYGVDRGMFMINSVFHKEVSSKCAYEKVCATKAAIKIAKNNKSLNAWHGFTSHCQ